MTERGRVGLIGGSGVYDLADLEDLKEERLETPFGAPSDSYFTGRLAGVPVVFFARHARGHRYAPNELNYRAAICGFKMLGCDALLSAGAVGSLREEYAPLHAVLPDQFLDRTRRRRDTFFGEGVVAHVSLAEPVCAPLTDALEAGARRSGLTVHRGGTYVCMEGPQFSTRAESLLYRSWGADVIGMTNLTEAKLAREAELCYATLALATDYDVWHESHAAVTVEAVVANLLKNVTTARVVLRRVIPRVGKACAAGCGDALASAVITNPKAFPPRTRRRLGLLLDRYFPSGKKGRRGG